MLKSKVGRLIIVAIFLFAFSSCGGWNEMAGEPQISDEMILTTIAPEHEEEIAEPVQTPDDSQITEEPAAYNEWHFDEISKELVESHMLDDLIPSGFTPFYATSGDLNADGITDIALLASSEDTLVRPLLLIVGDEAGRYALAKRNDIIIRDKDSGGIHGDPFEGLSIKEGELCICFLGGSSWRWEYYFEFTYSIHDSDWLLQKQYSLSYHFWPHVVTGYFLDSTLFGQVFFEDFGKDLSSDDNFDYLVGCLTVETVLQSNEEFYKYWLLNIPDKEIQGIINRQIQTMANNEIPYFKDSLDFNYSTRCFINPEVLSLSFGNNTVSFDLKTGNTIRLWDIVDVDKLSKKFWEIAQSEMYMDYYTNLGDLGLDEFFPDLSAAQLKELFSNADNPNSGASVKSYFYYDGILIKIDDDCSVFISYYDLKPMLKKDYWGQYLLESGLVPTVYEQG